MKLYQFVFLSLSIAVLAGCGGGGGGNEAPVVPTPAPQPAPAPVITDKFTGTWKSCTSVGFLRTAVITKNSDSVYAVDIKATSHAGFPCAGDGTPIPSSSGMVNFKIVGTKLTPQSSVTPVVDKTTDLDGGDKDIIFVKDGVNFTDGTTGTLLYLGDEFSGFDSDGFPNSLDIFRPFRKQ
jgi:hypothetical protein